MATGSSENNTKTLRIVAKFVTNGLQAMDEIAGFSKQFNKMFSDVINQAKQAERLKLDLQIAHEWKYEMRTSQEKAANLNIICVNCQQKAKALEMMLDKTRGVKFDAETVNNFRKSIEEMLEMVDSFMKEFKEFITTLKKAQTKAALVQNKLEEMKKDAEKEKDSTESATILLGIVTHIAFGLGAVGLTVASGGAAAPLFAAGACTAVGSIIYADKKDTDISELVSKCQDMKKKVEAMRLCCNELDSLVDKANGSLRLSEEQKKALNVVLTEILDKYKDKKEIEELRQEKEAIRKELEMKKLQEDNKAMPRELEMGKPREDNKAIPRELEMEKLRSEKEDDEKENKRLRQDYEAMRRELEMEKLRSEKENVEKEIEMLRQEKEAMRIELEMEKLRQEKEAMRRELEALKASK